MLLFVICCWIKSLQRYWKLAVVDASKQGTNMYFLAANIMQCWHVSKWIWTIFHNIQDAKGNLYKSFWLLSNSDEIAFLQELFVVQHTHTHTHPFNSPLFRTTRVSWYQKGKTNQEKVSGSGISWAVCKSAPRSGQITIPAPHHSVFYRSDVFPATQPTASKHWRHVMQQFL